MYTFCITSSVCNSGSVQIFKQQNFLVSSAFIFCLCLCTFNFRCLYVLSFHILSLSLYFRCLYVFSFHVFYFRRLCLLLLSLLVFAGFIVSDFKHSFTTI